MKKISYGLIIIFATMILVFFPTQEALACTPPKNPPSIIAQYIQSDIVFIGTVTNIEPSTSGSENFFIATNLATFDIHSKWKGNIGDTIKIESYSGIGTCGMHYLNNTSYLISSHSSENDYPQSDYFDLHVKLTDNIGLNFIKIVWKFIIDPFVLISLLIIIPTSIGIVVIKKRKRRDSK